MKTPSKVSAATGRRTLTAACETEYDAQVYADVKSFDGWQILVPPFASRQDLVDDGEETVRPVASEWMVVLHRF